MHANTTIRIHEIPQDNLHQEPPIEISQSPSDEDQPRLPRSFPVEALNEVQRPLVEAIINTFGQDPGVVGLTSCAVLSGAMGRSFLAEGGVPGLTTTGNTFTLVGVERSGGKGTVSTILMKPLIDANSELQKNYRDNTLPALRVRHRQIKNQLDVFFKAKEEPPQPEILVQLQREMESIERELRYPPALYSGSSTGAALVELLVRNEEQMMLFSPEAGDSVKVALGRYTSDGGADIDLMLSGFSVEPFSESRVGRGNNHLEKPCIATLWYVQPLLLRELLSNQQAIERGLAARFLYATCPENVVPYDDGTVRSIPHELTENWNSLVRGILSKRDQNATTITCHPEAVEVFRDFHNMMVLLRNGLYRDQRGDLGRAREVAIRIALGQCVADATSRREVPTILQPDHAERGVAIARYSFSQFVNITAPLRDELRLGKLEKIIQLCEGMGGLVKVSRLKNNHGITDEEINRLVAEYPLRIQLRTPPTGASGGRPSPVIVRVG